MRVDKYLSAVGLIQRSKLKREEVRLSVNGKSVKPSKEVKVGDVIYLTSPTLVFEIEVLDIPSTKSVPKSRREDYYKVRVFKRQKKEINSEFIKWLLED